MEHLSIDKRGALRRHVRWILRRAPTDALALDSHQTLREANRRRFGQRILLQHLWPRGRFDAETVNEFLDTTVILADGEEYLAYSQYLHTYLDHQAIVAALCTTGGGFVLNASGSPWKLLRKDLNSLAQTWSVLSCFNLVPTSHTSNLNVERARLIYGLVMKMDMDLGSFILGQITQIVQSSTSWLGFPALITALCDA